MVGILDLRLLLLQYFVSSTMLCRHDIVTYKVWICGATMLSIPDRPFTINCVNMFCVGAI